MPLFSNKKQDLPDLCETFRSLLVLGEKILSPRSVSTDTLTKKRSNDAQPETVGYIHRYRFEGYDIEFLYSPRVAPSTGAPSTLEARIYLDRSEPVLFFMPYDILPYINPDDFLCRHFPYIESEARMRACYQTLAESLVPYLISFKAIADDPALTERAYNDLKKEINRVYGVDIFSPTARAEDFDNSLLTLRFHHIVKWKSTFYASFDYNDFLLGDFLRAKDIPYRHKVRPDYIESLARFAARTPPFSYTPVPPEAASLSAMIETSRKSASMPLLILSCILSLPLFAGLYGLLYAVVSQIMASGAIFFTGATLSSLVNIVPYVIVSAVACTLASSRVVMKLFMRRRYEAYKPYLQMAKENPVRPVAGKMKKLILLGSVILITLSACRGVYFRQDDMLNRSGFLPFSGTDYEYRDIATVIKYIREDESFYYVIEFPGEKYFDLSEIMGEFDYRDVEEKLAPVFAAHNITVEEKEAPKNPFYRDPADTTTDTTEAETPSTTDQPEEDEKKTPAPSVGTEV